MTTAQLIAESGADWDLDANLVAPAGWMWTATGDHDLPDGDGILDALILGLEVCDIAWCEMCKEPT